MFRIGNPAYLKIRTSMWGYDICMVLEFETDLLLVGHKQYAEKCLSLCAGR